MELSDLPSLHRPIFEDLGHSFALSLFLLDVEHPLDLVFSQVDSVIDNDESTCHEEQGNVTDKETEDLVEEPVEIYRFKQVEDIEEPNVGQSLADGPNKCPDCKVGG